MRFFYGTIIGVCFVYAASAWVIPSTIKNWQQGASAAAIAVAIAGAPLVSHATSVDVTGSYSDPNHPNCQRVISSTKDGKSDIRLTGTDGNPGCPPDGSGKTWQLTGSVQGSNVFVDFSPKGGPKDLKGVFDENDRAIRWPDGNVWSQKN